MEGVWIAPVTAQVMMTLFRVVIFQLPILELCADFRARLALVAEQSHEAPVAPALPGDQFVGRDLRPAGPLDGLEYRSGPIDATLHGRKQPDIDFLVALDIVAHAAGSIEVNGLKRTHERPPQCEPVANADIDVFDSAHAVGDQAERLLEKRALHP